MLMAVEFDIDMEVVETLALEAREDEAEEEATAVIAATFTDPPPIVL